jgi:hypothetical protein
MKVEVKPTLSSTWSITAKSYNKNESCILSNDEGVSIADISIKRFFQFMQEQNVTIVGNKLQGTYIIGNDRSLYTVDMLNEWKDKFDERVETEILKTDLKEGYIYQTVCGSHLLFMGKRHYISGQIKGTGIKISKPSSEFFVIESYDETAVWRNEGKNATRLKQRIVKEIGKSIKDFTGWEEEKINYSQKYKVPAYFYLGVDKPNKELSLDYKIIDDVSTSSGFALYKDGFVYGCIWTHTYSSTYIKQSEVIIQRKNNPVLLEDGVLTNTTFVTRDYDTFKNLSDFKKVSIRLS